MTRRAWATVSAAGFALFAAGCGSSAPPEAPADPEELKRLDDEIKTNVRAEGAAQQREKAQPSAEKK